MIYTVATVGVIFVLLALVYTVAGLPLVLQAVESGGINLPSIEDTGVRFQLLREPVVYGVLSLGVDRCVFGVILLLCVPELTHGSRLAWRICLAIGLLFLVGYTPLICIVFERVHLPALVMPMFGLVIVVAIVVGRHGFSVDENGMSKVSENCRNVNGASANQVQQYSPLGLASRR